MTYPILTKPSQLAAAALLVIGAAASAINIVVPAAFAQTSGDVDTSPSSSTSSSTRFSCQLADGEYTVMYSPESEPDTLYAWAAPGDMGDRKSVV